MNVPVRIARLIDQLVAIEPAELAVLDIAARAPGRRITARWASANGQLCAEMEHLGWLRELRAERHRDLMPPLAATFVVTAVGRGEIRKILDRLRSERESSQRPIAMRRA